MPDQTYIDAWKKRQEIEENADRIRTSGLFPRHFQMTFETLNNPDEASLKCKAWSSNWMEENIFIYGDCGIRKTHLLAATANECLKKTRIKFIRAPDFASKLRIMGKSDYDEASEWISSLTSDKYPLFIDDFGVERLTDYTLEKFYLFFDDVDLRIRKGIMISSNLDIAQIAASMGDRIASRIAGNFSVLHLKGEDGRLKRGPK